MTDAGRKWVQLFEREGWFRYGKLDPNADLGNVGISYLGGGPTNMSLANVVEAADEFLIFEYGFDAASPDSGGQSGRAKVWIPWENIQYVFRTTSVGT